MLAFYLNVPKIHIIDANKAKGSHGLEAITFLVMMVVKILWVCNTPLFLVPSALVGTLLLLFLR